MKLGQQRTHWDWHHGCINSPGDYESEADFESYAHKEIICDGTTLGNVEAMKVCKCNDQRVTTTQSHSVLLT